MGREGSYPGNVTMDAKPIHPVLKSPQELPTVVRTRAPCGTAQTGPLHKKEAFLSQFLITSRVNAFVSSSNFMERQLVPNNKSSSKPGKKITFQTSTATAIAMRRGNGSQFTSSLFSMSFSASHPSPTDRLIH